MVLVFSFRILHAQQSVQFSLFHQIYSYVNPSYAGLTVNPKVSVLHRTQWLGYNSNDDVINGRPVNQLISFELPISLKSQNHDRKDEGIGVILLNDNIGIVNQVSLKVSLSKKITLAKDKKVSLGIRPGLLSQKIKKEDLVFNQNNDPVVEELLNASQNSKIIPSLDIGLWFSTNKTNIGLALNNALTNDNSMFFTQRTAVLDFNTNFKLSSKTSLIPLLNLFSDFRNLSYIVGVINQVNFVETDFDMGLMLRQSISKTNIDRIKWSNNDVILQIGMPNISNTLFSFYYSIDIVSTNPSAKSNSSHEIMISYNFRKNRIIRTNELYSPRYKNE